MDIIHRSSDNRLSRDSHASVSIFADGMALLTFTNDGGAVSISVAVDDVGKLKNLARVLAGACEIFEEYHGVRARAAA